MSISPGADVHHYVIMFDGLVCDLDTDTGGLDGKLKIKIHRDNRGYEWFLLDNECRKSKKEIIKKAKSFDGKNYELLTVFT